MRESRSLFRHLLTLLLYSKTFAALVRSVLHKLFQKSLLMECESERPRFLTSEDTFGKTKPTRLQNMKAALVQINPLNRCQYCSYCQAWNTNHVGQNAGKMQIHWVINPFLCPCRDLNRHLLHLLPFRPTTRVSGRHRQGPVSRAGAGLF